MLCILDRRVTAARLPAARPAARALSSEVHPEPPLAPLYETAQSALEKSGYLRIDWKISENATVDEAVKRMVANKIGCLAIHEEGNRDNVNGIFSERDFLNKVAVLERDPETTTVSEVATMGRDNLVTVTKGNPIDRCMEKMLGRDIRHLFVRRKEDGAIVGLLSVKDIVKCAHQKSLAKMEHLEKIINENQTKY
eukprot:CAMPEP_0172584878 /NCGR_PEP_ID=MMETSP1068-20121228/4430_1 /TAXON_ID=35684 /ORGANISM="Pseudopedinella elastica, Strain CCMP716" /LENGTH=194 /DNA_ID=CAMNT_0013379187 /DNA_START=157 /DNA_END=741 /DNA_ORIENTATION=-